MTVTRWPRVKLADHVDLVSGFPFKSAGFTADPKDIPLVKGENVHQGYIDWDKAKRWPRDQIEGLDKYWLKPGDVILAMDRPWIEAGLKQACIQRHDPPSLLVQRVSRLRGVNGLLTGYLRQLIASSAFTDYIKPIVTGINVPHISGAQIKGFDFILPPGPVQERSASILAAYDDLIENNTRRITILEEMARRIYEEWFVRFRFPGHDDVRMVESELGLVPEGWVVAPLGGIAKLLSGFAFKSSTFVENGDYGLVTIKNVHDGVFIENCTSRLSNPPGNMPTHCSLKVADILLSLTGNVGRCCLVTVDGCLLNQRVAKIQPVKEFDWAYSYLMFRSTQLQEQLKAIANGVAQQNLSPIETQRILVLLPPEVLRQHFADTAAGLLRLALTLLRSNTNLRTTRDLLLPKLISGELDVSELPEPEALPA